MAYNRAMSARLIPCALILALGLLAACSPFSSGAFQCSQDQQCDGLAGGVCQTSTGFCSFPDETCPSGQRYGELADDSLASTCVGEVVVPTEPFCNPAGQQQVVCFRFEGNTNDESGNSNNPASSDATFAPGKDGMAVRTGAATELDIADSTSLDVDRITFEAWVNPSTLPTDPAMRVGVFDTNGQYGFFIHGGGIFRCTLGAVTNGPYDVASAVQTNVWTHLACSYDGSNVTVYVNGESKLVTPATGVPGSGNNVAALAGNAPDGDPFIGLIDSVRLWNVARTAEQICAAAGTCP